MKVWKLLRDKDTRFLVLRNHGFYHRMPDEVFLKRLYRIKMGVELDLEHPQTFNEKLQWLKLHDRKPEYTKMVDKYEAKQYVAGIIGEEHIIPTLGVWDRFEDIDFDALPEQFVLKCTHDSGNIVICKDRKELDLSEAKEKLERGQKRNYYWVCREWPYRDVKPRIIAEQYMIDESAVELKDYKVFNFHGEPKLIQVDFDRFSAHKRNLYTTDWERLEFTVKYPGDPERVIPRPECLEEMLEMARKLSKGIAFLRTDFYVIAGKIFFGELTFYHGAGYELFDPPEWDRTLGDWIELPEGR